MRDELVDLADRVDAAVVESAGVLATEDLDRAGGVAEDVRLRLSYPSSILVVALAGGTGSGKSSLFNAIAGDEIALTGGIRPMTVKPLALVPTSAESVMAGYLDAIGVSDRVTHDGPAWLCLIDLPDNDSVELDHRHQVDSLLPRVDVVVWVTDPEKYRDASLHQGHIGRLGSRQAQFVYVLNQADRLSDEDVSRVSADFAQALREDRIVEPKVIAVAASPPAGPPLGVETLLARLGEMAGEGSVHARLHNDLRGAAALLATASSRVQAVEFEGRWRTERDKAVGLVLDGRIADGGLALSRFLGAVGDEAGGEIGEELREQATTAQSRVLGVVVEVTTAEDSSGRRRRKSRRKDDDQNRPDGRELRDALDREVGDPARELLARRQKAHASIIGLVARIDQVGPEGT